MSFQVKYTDTAKEDLRNIAANISRSPFARAGVFDIITLLKNFQYTDFQYSFQNAQNKNRSFQ